MKKLSFLLASIVSLVIFSSCGDKTCTSISKQEAFFLFDATDSQMFAQITDDIETNMSDIVSKKGWTNLPECTTLKFFTAPINANEAFELVPSNEVGVTDLGLSYNEQNSRKSLKPLSTMLFKSLDDYKEMTSDSSLTNGSNILNVVLKTLNRVSPTAKTSVFVFSDMLENNDYVNFYKGIPANENVAVTLDQLIDPQVRSTFDQKNEQHNFDNTEIIIVQKGDFSATEQRRQVRRFWQEAFDTLGLTNIKFVDNLTGVYK